MKASELIAELHGLIAKHGDLIVKSWDDRDRKLYPATVSYSKYEGEDQCFEVE